MHIPQLTFLRFVAASFVVVLHYGLFTAPFSWDGVVEVLACGALGVPFFFTLSGFLLAWVHVGRDGLDVGAYARARVARIAPMHVLAYGLGMVLMLTTTDARPGFPSWVAQLLALHAWWPDYEAPVNFPSWTISVEVFLYALFPWLLGVLRGQRGRVLLLAAGIPWALGLVQMLLTPAAADAWLRDPNDYFLLRFPLWHVNAFVVGMCGGIWLSRNRDALRAEGQAAGLLALCAVVLVGLCYIPGLMDVAANGLLSPLYLLVMVAVTQDRGWVARAFSWGPLQLLGEASYSLYLLQAPWAMLMKELFPQDGVPFFHGWEFPVYFVGLVMVSVAVYVGVERPLRRWLRRRPGKI